MKTNINITIDSEIVAELRIRRINISATINDYLRSFLEIQKDVSGIEDYSTDIIKVEAKLVSLKQKQQLAEIKREKEDKEKLRISNLSFEEKLKEGVPVKIS